MTEASALEPAAGPILPAETVMIGDSDVDILTARNAGARAIGCSYGLAPHTLAAAAPDALVNSPSEWPKALETC
jgi:phosphoglycolate phosphatase